MNLLPATGVSAAPRSRRKGCLRVVGTVALVLLCIVDPLLAALGGSPLWMVLLVPPLGAAAVRWPTARRPAWLTPQLRTAVPAGLSLALTLASAMTGQAPWFGPGEEVILLCLLLVAIRTCPPLWAVGCAVLNGAAILAQPLRLYQDFTAPGGDPDGLSGMVQLFLLLVGGVAALGGYLRVLDKRRQAAVTETRRSERLAMAADLHDFVAHHVTGILVQAQVARLMATTGPDGLDAVLDSIERAATEALASMRRTVGILREGPQEVAGLQPADRQPMGGLTALADLVAGFAGPVGPKAELRQATSVPQDLPYEVQSAAHRVVQEALTNVRRHAADATEVKVGLTYDDGTLQVTVRDNGRGGTQMPHAARGGGFGIVGLTERVTALGGELRTGPRSADGWEVVATLPAPA